MSYSWFRVEAAIANNPKVLAFEEAIGDPNGLAYITRLHCWTHVYATSGAFSRTVVSQLEAFCKWRGEAGKLVSTLVKCGLIDATRRTLETHDWADFQGALVKKSKKDAEVKKERREAEKKSGARPARAAHAPGAQPAPAPNLPNLTYETGRDGRDETILVTPDQKLRSEVPQPTSNRGEKSWGALAEKLAVWMQAQRSLSGNVTPDRAVDVAAVDEWALNWVLKHEPDAHAYDVMCQAFNGFLENGPGDRSLSLWCTENVWLQRWNAERAKEAA